MQALCRLIWTEDVHVELAWLSSEDVLVLGEVFDGEDALDLSAVGALQL